MQYDYRAWSNEKAYRPYLRESEAKLKPSWARIMKNMPYKAVITNNADTAGWNRAEQAASRERWDIRKDHGGSSLSHNGNS